VGTGRVTGMDLARGTVLATGMVAVLGMVTMATAPATVTALAMEAGTMVTVQATVTAPAMAMVTAPAMAMVLQSKSPEMLKNPTTLTSDKLVMTRAAFKPQAFSATSTPLTVRIPTGTRRPVTVQTVTKTPMRFAMKNLSKHLLMHSPMTRLVLNRSAKVLNFHWRPISRWIFKRKASNKTTLRKHHRNPVATMPMISSPKTASPQMRKMKITTPQKVNNPTLALPRLG